jgi:hypothetical protein
MSEEDLDLDVVDHDYEHYHWWKEDNMVRGSYHDWEIWLATRNGGQ